jgi:hypothetical protein
VRKMEKMNRMWKRRKLKRKMKETGKKRKWMGIGRPD